jgi:site-specific DNA recombinase
VVCSEPVVLVDPLRFQASVSKNAAYRTLAYRNEHVGGLDAHGNFLKSHTRRVVDETEAAVVVRIFELYDSGLGLKAIAKRLTSEQAPAPKPIKSADVAPCHGWSPSTVRSVLTRTTYHGVVVWNKTKKKNAWGKRDVTDRPQSDWITTRNDDLKIINDDLWNRVAARRREMEAKAIRFASGRISGRPPTHASVNLLPGLAVCGTCGGGLIVEHSNNRKGHYAYYVCHRRRARSGCTNTLRMPIEEMNEAILLAVEEHALTPEAVESVLLSTERHDVADHQQQLQREAKDLAKQIDRLVTAIAAGGDMLSLIAKVKALEARKAAITSEVSNLRPVPRLAPAVIETRLAE